METLEFIEKSADGKIVIQLPQGWEDKQVIIKVSQDVSIPELDKWKQLPKEEKLRILQYFAGSAKYPDTPTDKYEVYEQ